jgi:Xaa-Pro aminopeptidase
VIDRLGEIQLELRVLGLAGWLLCDFRGQNPIAARALGVSAVPLTRRWFYYISADAMPVLLVHATEADAFDDAPGDHVRFTSWSSLRAALDRIVPSGGKIAMEFCAMGSNPYLSRVDAGTVDLVRSYGAEVVSSGDLVQHFLCRWEPGQLAAHQRAATALGELCAATVASLGAQLRAGESVHELDVQEQLVRGLEARGLVTEGRPIVAAGVHSASPHYVPSPSSSALLARGDVVLLELWAREPAADAPFAEMAWMAVVAERVPPAVAAAFAVVVEARDRALELVRSRRATRKRVLGFEVDRVARDVVARHGHAERFPHRTGHHLATVLNSGDAATLDDLEIHDTRELVPGLAWVVHPGLYFESFGLRTAVDVYLDESGLLVTTPLQRGVTPLLAPP